MFILKSNCTGLTSFIKFLVDSKDSLALHEYILGQLDKKKISQTALVKFYEFCISEHDLVSANFILKYIDNKNVLTIPRANAYNSKQVYALVDTWETILNDVNVKQLPDRELKDMLEIIEFASGKNSVIRQELLRRENVSKIKKYVDTADTSKLSKIFNILE